MSIVKRQKTDPSPTGLTQGKTLYNTAVSLEAHTGPVYTATFNSTGEFIATGGHDKFINIWKLPKQQQDVNVGCIRAHKNAVTCIKWLDSDIVSGSADSTLAFWDLDSGVKIRNCKNESIINEIDISGQLVVSGDDSGNVKFWDKRVKTAINCISTKFPILTCKFNNKGTNLFFSGIDSTINTYDPRKPESPLWTCDGPIDSVTSLAINSDDSMLISRCIRGSINTYNAKEFVNVTRSSPYVYEGKATDSSLTRVCFSNDDLNIISGTDQLTVWDVATRRVVNKFGEQVLDVDCHPEERIIVSSGEGVVVREF